MTESFLEKNLIEIEKYDSELAEQIRNHNNITGNFEFGTTKCGDANLIQNGIPIHDAVDAVGEASKIWQQTSFKESNVVHFIFGLGLTYVLNKFAQNAKGKIIVYEPNINTLRITLEVVDLSEILAKNNIRIFQDKFKLKLIAENLYKKDDEMTLSFLSSYKQLYPQELADFLSELEILKSLFLTGYSEVARQSSRWAHHSITNLNRILKNDELDALKDKFKDKPAVIVSAGPSLNKSIETIKQNRDKIVVICVNVALKTLLKNNITPDFVCVLEAGGCTPSVEGVDTSNMNFIMVPEVNPDIYNKEFKRVFNYYSENLLTSDWIESFTQINCQDYMNRGTVSILALWSAYLMGCNPITLTGQDLAFSGGRCYAKDSTFNLICELNPETEKFEVKSADFDEYMKQGKIAFKTDDNERIKKLLEAELQRRSASIITVKGQNGEPMPTSSGYALFIKHFEELIPIIKNVKLFNSSEGGAQINGYENKPLEEILKEFGKESFSAEEIIENSTSKYIKPHTKDSLDTTFNENIKVLSDCSNVANNALKTIKKFNNQYKRTKLLTNDLSILLKKTHDYYISIVRDYFKRSRLIMAFLYNLHLLTEESLDNFENEREKVLPELIESYRKFFATASNFDEIIKELKEKKEQINESRNTAC